MIECDYCFNVLDESEAISYRGRYFCSEECQMKFKKEEEAYDMMELDYDEDEEFLKDEEDDILEDDIDKELEEDSDLDDYDAYDDDEENRP